MRNRYILRTICFICLWTGAAGCDIGQHVQAYYPPTGTFVDAQVTYRPDDPDIESFQVTYVNSPTYCQDLGYGIGARRREDHREARCSLPGDKIKDHTGRTCVERRGAIGTGGTGNTTMSDGVADYVMIVIIIIVVVVFFALCVVCTGKMMTMEKEEGEDEWTAPKRARRRLSRMATNTLGSEVREKVKRSFSRSGSFLGSTWGSTRPTIGAVGQRVRKLSTFGWDFSKKKEPGGTKTAPEGP